MNLAAAVAERVAEKAAQSPGSVQLICREVCQVRRARYRREAIPAVPLCFMSDLCGERVVSRRAVRLIFADWVPQEGVSAGSRPRV